MPLRLKIHHKGLFIVAVPLVVGTIFMLFLYAMLMQSESEARDESHANDVLHSVFILGRELFDGINTLTAYSYSKSPAMEKKYRDSRKRIVTEFALLRKNLADYPDQLKQVERTERVEMRALKMCDGLFDAFQNQHDTDMMTMMNIRGMRNQMEALVEQTTIELRELNGLVQRQSGAKSDAAVKWRSNAKVLLLWGVGLNVALSVIIVLYFSRAITDRLKILMSNAKRLAGALPLLPPIPGDDEISELDKVFHQMAETVEESKAKQKALVDNAVDVLCSIDASGIFTNVSPSSESVWGYKDSELVGKCFTEIIVEDDIEDTLNALDTIKLSASSMPIENRVVCPDGKIISVLWSVFWSESEDILYCVAHDITARKMFEKVLKESEERTRTIMESLPVGLVVIDENGKIRLANKKTESMFGSRQSDLVGRNLSTLLKSNDTPPKEDWMEELINSSSGHIMELSAVRRDNLFEFPVELSSNKTQMGNKDAHLVAMLDVSERHEIERLKREFVAMVSHDLKTPLSSVRGMLVLLSAGAAGELPPKAGPIVQSAEEQLERLIKLINDLLDVQKMESGKFSVELKDVSIRALLEESFDAVEQVADDSGVTIEISGGDERVLADPDRILQVIINLLSNAIKFSPRESKVNMRIVNEADFVEVRVEDQGRGIKKEFQETIFERFKQVEKLDSTEKKGTGLGLAICKMIVEEHGGSIGVVSEDGTGSTFWFRLKHPPA
ncbi:PAS domain S-box protein [Candidatus Obscuribacterales bacterium]|nr:PAS domain S-box protein [Candidatus Obscuribacterales bacterium]